MNVPDFDARSSRRGALRLAADTLASNGIEAAGDARFLVLGALGVSNLEFAVAGDAALGADGADRLRDALRRRLSGEPVARILGGWEFWGLPFRLSPATLVPRPDTETVVETALRAIPDRGAQMRVLDLGTGSGCILVALLSELPAAFGIGLDRSAGALRTARANAEANGVAERAAFVAGDWCAPLDAPFDLVVSNPPYIASAVLPGLAREVRDHDPAAALDGGPDGLDAYRRILSGVGSGLLDQDGTLVVEVGFDQADAVADLGRGVGLVPRGVTRDLAGHARVVAFGPRP